MLILVYSIAEANGFFISKTTRTFYRVASKNIWDERIFLRTDLKKYYMEAFNATVYTDGSCHTQSKTGAWVAILLIGTEEIILSETVMDTTHNRMELTAVIAAIQHVLLHYRYITQLQVFSDSQYVIGLPGREAALTERNFITQKGNELQNTSLVRLFLQLLTCISVELVKIKAHQKKSEAANYNIKADRLSRKLVREENKK